ncbi:hypothetical protein DEI91_09995 [Curtobacterium sp. MCBD17_032]|nr:hypothetical protein DEI91_09995 [Curtobacterium sp. MCBD17_032]
MLVSMKQTVLENADDRRPKRRGHRSGIVVAAVALLALGTASGAVALAVVPQMQQASAPVASPTPQAPSPSGTPSSAPVVETPEPTPTRTTSAASTRYPTDCGGLYSDADRARFFGGAPVTQTPERLDGTTMPAPAPVPFAGGTWTASTWIECTWKDPRADISHITVRMGSAPENELGKYEASLREEAGTCDLEDIGTVCTRTVRADPYPVDATRTFWTQDGYWVDIDQANMPTSGLLQATIDAMLGDRTVAGSWTISGGTIGPLTVGSPLSGAVGEVEQTYDRLPVDGPCEPGALAHFTRPGKDLLRVFTADGVVTALALEGRGPVDPGTIGSVSPTTAEGTGIGSTLADLRRAHPDLALVGSYAFDGTTDGADSFWSIERDGMHITFQLDSDGERVDLVWVARTVMPPLEYC